MNCFGSTRRSAIGLDVGTRNVKAVQLTHGTRGTRVEAVACFPREAAGQPVTRAECRRIANVLTRRGFVGNEVVLACPTEKLLTTTMEFPAKAAGNMLEAATRNEFLRSHKCDVKTLEMTWWSLPAPARAAKTVNVMAVACPHAEADAVIETFEAGGLQVVGLDVRTWAMARAAVPPESETATSSVVMLLDLGWAGATLLAMNRGVVIYERAMPDAGVRAVESALSDSIHLDPEAARHYLFNVGMGDAASHDAADDVSGDVRAVVSGHFEAVAQEVTASIGYCTQQYPEAPVVQALLVGGGAMIPGLPEYLRGLLGVECKTATPLGRATASGEVAAQCNALATTATGLALFNDF